MAGIFTGVERLGGPASTELGTPFSVGESLPDGVVHDGSFVDWQPNTPPLIVRPFSNDGDWTSKELHIRGQGRIDTRGLIAPGTRAPSPNNDCYLYAESEPEDQHALIGNWVRSYANIPAKRSVPESYSFGFQYITTNNTTVTLAEQSFTVASLVEYEYFLYENQGDFPVLQADRAIQLTSTLITTTGDNGLTLNNPGLTVFISAQPRIVAEASSYQTYHFPIMCRKTRWIASPTVAFWGTEITLP